MVTLIILLPLGFVMGKPYQTMAQEDGLFTDVPYESGVQSSEPSVVRTRYVRPDFETLTTAGLSLESPTLALNLFDDANFTGIIEQIQPNQSGSTTWIGRLAGVEWGTFTIVTKDGVMVGTVKMPGAFYRITYVGDLIHAIYELDEAAFPPELEPIESRPSTAAPAAALAPSADDGSVVDVLVVYTDDARANIGDAHWGKPAGYFTTIENMIDLAIAETNTSYSNSGISHRFNLVHTEEISFSEVFTATNWWNTTLISLTETSDGYIDNVHSLRNNYCADIVVLLVDKQTSCGLAWVGPGESDAFSVVSTYCATGFYSFGHETGHNFGARHDWYVDGNNTFAHGYVNWPNAWRTIMSYNTECAAHSTTCSRLQYWSNPAVLYGGDPMGIPESAGTGCNEGTPSGVCAADTRQKLNETAATIAGFRDSSICRPTYTISGNVQTAAGAGIDGVNVGFGGTPAGVTTDVTGIYSQTGFVNGTYPVTFSKTGYAFQPAQAAVTVSGANKIQGSTGYPAASLVFTETFESGSLGTSWFTETITEGRVVISTTFPNNGSYSLLLDDYQGIGGSGDNSYASATLVVDLSGHTQVDLSFWWREFSDENNAEDGVFISDDSGNTWYRAFSFNNGPETYTQTIVDIDSAAITAGMSLNDHFMIKFQFYDNFPIGGTPGLTDGYAIDDICVGCTHIYFPLVMK